MTQAQQGKCLSKALANKIIAWSIHSRELVTGENTTTLVNSELSLVAMQQACLGAITSLLQQTDGDDYAEQAQQVYLLYLHDTNVSLVQASIEGIKLLIDRNLLSKASIAQIIDYLGVCKNSSLTRQIINLLPKTELSTQQQFAIKLLSINIEDDSQYLEQCSTLAVDGRFFPDNFCRIQQILARSEALRLTALRLLLTCSNIQDIPVGLVETVGVIERVVLRKKSNYSLNKY